MASFLPLISDSPQRRFWWLTALALLVLAGLWFFYATPALYGPRLNREILVWPVTLLLLWLYWAGAQAVRSQAVSTRTVWISGILLTAVAVLIPPFHSTDLFGYINRGWQQLHYGLNPYVYTVDAIPQWEADPMITDHWVNNPSPYGFLYLLIAKTLCALGAGHKAQTMLVFKLSNGLVSLATAALLWSGVRAAQTRKALKSGWASDPRLALYLYLWNPLILIHGLANGHNDLWMGFFVTLAAFVGLIGSWLWVLPALMAATLIKYGALVIVPLAVLFLIKNRAWPALGGGLVLSLMLFGLTGLPFLPNWQQFHLSEINHNAFVSHGSLHSLVYSAFKTLDKTALPFLHPHREAIRALLKNLLLGSYGLIFVGLCWRRFRQANYATAQWVRDSLLVMALLISLVSLKFYPWYLGMFFPLALFLPEKNWLRQFVLVLSGAQLFSITLIGQAHMLNFLVMTGLPLAWLFGAWKQGWFEEANEGVS